jgi:hypothetical protein
LELDVRVQRLRPPHRQRDWQRRRWRQRRNRSVGRDRADAALQHRVRRSDLVVVARRAAAPRERPRDHVEAAPNGPHTRRAPAMGRVGS